MNASERDLEKSSYWCLNHSSPWGDKEVWIAFSDAKKYVKTWCLIQICMLWQPVIIEDTLCLLGIWNVLWCGPLSFACSYFCSLSAGHIPSMLQILEARNMKGCHCWMKQSRPKDNWHRRRDNLTGFLRTGASQLSLSLKSEKEPCVVASSYGCILSSSKKAKRGISITDVWQGLELAHYQQAKSPISTWKGC